MLFFSLDENVGGYSDIIFGDNSRGKVQDQVGSSSAPSPSTQEPIVPQRIHHILANDHPVHQIMVDISKGVQTRSRIASFCEHYFLYLFLNLTM